MSATPNDVISDIYAELASAIAKFPTWPTDPLHALAVLGEEFGELTKDVLQMTYEPGKTNAGNVRKEAIQTAAMALRFAASLDAYQYKPCEQHRQPQLDVGGVSPSGNGPVAGTARLAILPGECLVIRTEALDAAQCRALRDYALSHLPAGTHVLVLPKQMQLDVVTASEPMPMTEAQFVQMAKDLGWHADWWDGTGCGHLLAFARAVKSFHDIGRPA